jgi:hypothetical protein
MLEGAFYLRHDDDLELTYLPDCVKVWGCIVRGPNHQPTYCVSFALLTGLTIRHPLLWHVFVCPPYIESRIVCTRVSASLTVSVDV